MLNKIFLFLTSPVGIIISKIVGVMAVIAILFAAWNSHIRSIEQRAFEKWEKAQIEQVLREQNEFREQLNEISRIQNTILERRDAVNQTIIQDSQDLRDYINDPRVEDRPSSVVLKETVRRIRDR